MYFTDATETRIRKISRQIDEAAGKADLVREEKTSCSCCRKIVDNTKKEYGYENFYYLEADKFLCEKCYFKKIFFKNMGLIILITLIIVPIDVWERTQTRLKRIPHKIIDKLDSAIKKLENLVSDIEKEIFEKMMKDFRDMDPDTYARYSKVRQCMSEVSIKLYRFAPIYGTLKIICITKNMKNFYTDGGKTH